jgi:subtilisin family serine protease
MSFSFPAPSTELSTALNVATAKGLISVASAGNNGNSKLVWPAAYSSVMGVASTTDNDTKSTFSNYGTKLVWVAAPGEAIVTTYPGNTYAATWGTSFSAPFVSGTAALLNNVSPKVNESNARAAIGNAVWIEADLNKGRLNTLTAVAAWRHALGLQ